MNFLKVVINMSSNNPSVFTKIRAFKRNKMKPHSKLIVVLHISFILLYNAKVFANLAGNEEGRVKRQDGYVYDKPSISFNLPTRPPPTVSTTQAPTVNRPQAQQMYYAYPAPAAGDTINIGYSTAGSSSTTGATTSGVTTSASTGGYNYGAQTTATSTLGSTSSGSNAGYNYNTPTSTSPGTTADSVSQTVSTNAPKYLPPISEGSTGTSGGGGTSGGVSVNVPTGGSTTTSVSTTTQTSSSAVALPNTDYLPPLANQQPSPGSSPTPGTPPTPTAGYLPPSGSPPVSVPTPAATYLPPVL